jgi:hypothetical protein
MYIFNFILPIDLKEDYRVWEWWCMTTIPATQEMEMWDHALRPAHAKVNETLSQNNLGMVVHAYNPSYLRG